MTESPPNAPYPVTVHHDPTIGLTVGAWPASSAAGGWLVRFLRRNAQRKLLDQTTRWLPGGGWNPARWHPVGARLIPPTAPARMASRRR